MVFIEADHWDEARDGPAPEFEDEFIRGKQRHGAWANRTVPWSTECSASWALAGKGKPSYGNGEDEISF